MADRSDTDFLEILRGQIGQEISGDSILAELRRILFEIQPSQPVYDVHRRPLTRLGEITNRHATGPTTPSMLPVPVERRLSTHLSRSPQSS
jgi:hypothetical protein